MTTPSSASTRSRRRQFDSLEQEVFLNLWRTYDRLKAIEEEVFAEAGLSAQQYNALRLLNEVAPEALPTQELGSQLISRAPDMTRLLDRLEQRGLLRRARRTDNRRVVEVSITAEGRALLERLAQAVRQCHHRQLGHLDAAALRQLVRLLKDARRPHEDAARLSFVDE